MLLERETLNSLLDILQEWETDLSTCNTSTNTETQGNYPGGGDGDVRSQIQQNSRLASSKRNEKPRSRCGWRRGVHAAEPSVWGGVEAMSFPGSVE